MAEHGITVRDVARLEVARVGRVEETDDRVMPFRLLDDQGVEIAAVTEFLHHMLADDASAVSLRSYAYELLSWHRFLRAVEVPWHLAGRTEARDFALWLKTSKKPLRQRRPDAPAPGSVNPITGKATSGANYAARTRRHARAVIRSFYEYHREMHGRPLVNPFPKARGVDEHLNAHHNPMRPFRRPSRRAVYQPKEPKPAPRSIPDQAFSELFAALDCNRDRALVAFYMSTGARASELLGVCQGLVVPEEQVISVVRKGSRALQRLPASTDAFVWLRLYQQETRDLVPKGPKEAVWWTLRRPFRPLTYDAARMVFNKANTALGANWTLHDLRHSAAMSRLTTAGSSPAGSSACGLAAATCIASWRPSAASSSVLPGGFQRHDHAHLAGAVDHRVVHVARHHALADFERSRAAQRHVLADGRDRVRNRGLDRDGADLGGLDLLDVGAGVERDLRDHLDQSLELLVARDEVGLGIDLDHDALGARRQRADQAFRRDAAGLLRGLRQALLAQPVDRRLHVAVVLGERLLAVHHADAGRLAQVLDHRRCDCCHRCNPLPVRATAARPVAASPPSTIRNYVKLRSWWPEGSGQRV